MRNTPAAIRVAEALRREPGRRHWGHDLIKTTGLNQGLVYPILREMAQEGLLARAEPQAGDKNTRPRTYYTLTEKGLQALDALVAETPPSVRHNDATILAALQLPASGAELMELINTLSLPETTVALQRKGEFLVFRRRPLDDDAAQEPPLVPQRKG